MIKQRIAIDMDNVIADTMTQFLKYYNLKFNGNLTKKDVSGKPELAAFPPQHQAEANKALFEIGYFRGIPVMEGAREVVAMLAEHYEIFIASAATQFPQSMTEKLEWMDEHFPFIPQHHIVFCGSKSVIRAEYMIDDYEYNLDAFIGKGILFTAGHNIHLPTKHIRALGWDDVAKILL